MLPNSQQPLLSHPLQKMLISGLTQPFTSQTVSKGDAPEFGKTSSRTRRGNAESRWEVLCPVSIPQNRGTLRDTPRPTKSSLGSLLAVEDLRCTILVVEKSYLRGRLYLGDASWCQEDKLMRKPWIKTEWLVWVEMWYSCPAAPLTALPTSISAESWAFATALYRLAVCSAPREIRQ